MASTLALDIYEGISQSLLTCAQQASSMLALLLGFLLALGRVSFIRPPSEVGD